ncbi:unnamed protein product [Clonostachys rosea]|uniref:GAR domain-containing protein n=1 Tax=Bionectria ochroleuca TaxID=29856 RepID=A0ABY6TT37_BIOOC|nr:unnamed protein product [Clonostachys rosea]
MNDPPPILRPGRIPSGGQSPSKLLRPSNDILVHISPATVVDALASPTGPLKACLDGASNAECEFAMQTAISFKKIWEWTRELRDWYWPNPAGPAGFEVSSARRKLDLLKKSDAEPAGQEYIGCVRTDDILRFEERIEVIQYELEALSVDDLKNHVMNNHIMPLSRPTTPASIRSGFSTMSSYVKMEDLTAVVTAIVVQTLPILARLNQLLRLWTIRLAVLHRIPSLLQDLEDAEVALDSGWNVISPPSNSPLGDGGNARGPSLTRSDFNVMKVVIEKKITKPGSTLDYMLDRLEGMPDTLPEEWLDRMEALEEGYGDWVVACERRIQESDWGHVERPSSHLAEKEAPVKTADTKLFDKSPALLAIDEQASSLDPPEKDDLEGSSESNRAVNFSAQPLDVSNSRDTNDSEDVTAESPQSAGNHVISPTVKIQPPEEEVGVGLGLKLGLDGVRDGLAHQPSQSLAPGVAATTTSEMTHTERPIASLAPSLLASTCVENAGVDDDSDEPSHLQPSRPSERYVDPEFDEFDKGLLSTCEEEDEDLELPPLRNERRRDSVSSLASTVLHDTSMRFDGMSSDFPEVSASPGVARSRVREAEYIEASPPSSPPVPKTSSRQLPDSPLDDVDEYDNYDDSTLPRTPIEGSFSESFFDDSYSVSEAASPIMRRESLGAQHLHQQISQIIDRIPAKIKLTEKPPINLNPPDLQLPKLRKKPSKEPFNRSRSSLSSRTAVSRNATPSFTLSPAKTTRPRQSKGQDIKVYHLARSTGEAPIKLSIRCVGESGERVMVRVGGGWADLSEYLNQYASHHGRRSVVTENTKVEVQDLPRAASRGPDIGSSPPSRSVSALEAPMSPLAVRKTRRSVGSTTSEAPRLRQSTPGLASRRFDESAVADDSFNRSMNNSRMSWREEDSSFLGLAGPNGKKVEMSEESKAWVESVKEKVRLASGERRVSAQDDYGKNRFGELGKVGGTKRIFPKK